MPGDERFAALRHKLESHGWELVRIRGSHHTFKKQSSPLLVVPVHRGRVKAAYVHEIEKRIRQAEEEGAGG